jgi:hypothetical protein
MTVQESLSTAIRDPLGRSELDENVARQLADRQDVMYR